jgi:hypothetical protein
VATGPSTAPSTPSRFGIRMFRHPVGPVGRRQLSGSCSNRSNISDAKEFSGSQVGSQRRQLPGDTWPHPSQSRRR